MEFDIKKFKVLNTNNNINIVFNLKNNFKLSGKYNHSSEDFETTQTIKSVTVSGVTESRLNEIKKYGFNQIGIENKYFIHSNNSDGVILIKSDENKITYVIDNITYIDDLNENLTNFILKTNKIDNLKEKLLFLDDKYYGYLDFKINNNLVFERQDINVLETHYRLKAIKNIEDFKYYGGGFFKVYKL